MTDAIHPAPLQPDPTLPWPRALKVHLVYCIVQTMVGAVLMAITINAMSNDFTLAKVRAALTTFSDHYVDIYFSLVVLTYGVLFIVAHIFGMALLIVRGAWRWRFWMLVGGIMAAISPYSPFTLALGIPALILWSLQSTRLYLERDRADAL